MAEDLNYYQILELPLEPLERRTAAALAQIDLKEKEWNKKINALGNKGIIYKSYRAQTADMRKAFAQPGTLAAQGDEALKRACEAKKQYLAKAANGTREVPQAMFLAICRKSPALSEQCVGKLARGMGLTISSAGGNNIPVPTKPTPPPGLALPNAAQLSDLECCLPVLKAKTLYEALGCTPASSLSVIQQKLQERMVLCRRMTDKTKPEATAWNTVCTVAKPLFADEAHKKGFDYAWADYLVRRKLSEDIDIQVVDKTVSYDHYRSLVKSAREMGMSEEEAEWFVYDECCNRRKAPMPAPPAGLNPVPKQEQCPHCFALNDPGSKRCSSCLNWLVVTCPGCKKETRVAQSVCSCGFALCNMPLATQAVAKAQRDMAAGMLTEAALHVADALLYWPGNEEAEALNKVLERKRQDEERRVFQAVLIRLKSPAAAQVKSTPAGHLLIRWKPASYNGREILPGESFADAEGAKHSVVYRLIRKEGGIPVSEQDGICVATSAANSYEDVAALPGVVYGYSVFAGAEGVMVPMGCPCGKGLVPATPSLFAATPGNNSLSLSWTPEKNVREIILVRKRGGMPSGLSDGVRLSPDAGAGAYYDTGLDNDCSYGYLLAFAYDDGQGGRVVSPCARIQGIPVAPPAALLSSNWSVELKGSEVTVTWSAPGAEEVRWLISKEAIAPGGTLMPNSDSRLAAATPFPRSDNSFGKAVCMHSFVGMRYVTPLVCRKDVVLVCEPKTIASCADITHLRVQRDQQDLYLIFDWPEGCDEVVVAHDTTQFPQTPHAANRLSCTKQVYSYEKSICFQDVGNDTLYFSVFAHYNTGAAEYFSAPATICSMGPAARKSIRYRLVGKKKGFIFGPKQWTVEVTTDGDTLPALLLRAKRGGMPVNRADGMQILVTQKQNAPGCILPLKPDQVKPQHVYMLFLADPADAARYTIYHSPATETMI